MAHTNKINISEMGNALFTITRDERYCLYQLLPQNSLEEAKRTMMRNRNLVDFNYIYGHDLQDAGEGCAFVPMIERIFMIDDQSRCESFCGVFKDKFVQKSNHSGSVENGLFFCRTFFSFRPKIAAACTFGLCEVISLQKAPSVTMAMKTLVRVAREMEQINYFNIDFDFDGSTRFLGVASIVAAKEAAKDHGLYARDKFEVAANVLRVPLSESQKCKWLRELEAVAVNRKKGDGRDRPL